MRPAVLVIHNRYQQRGGEDTVVASEVALLRAHGHQVWTLIADNSRIADKRGITQAAGLALTTVWSRPAAERVRAAIERLRPDVVHVHNTLPLVSPSVYYACSRTKTPVVQTLHNYRLLCPAATFFRDGAPCEDCLGHLPVPGVIHRCYRGSVTQSATVAGMLTTHHLLGTWQHKVDRYIALTEFARGKFIEGGLPAERIAVKPNFVDPDPGPGTDPGDYLLFVGRLDETKGVHTLLDAWQQRDLQIPLTIVGTGPLQELVEEAARHNPTLRYLGLQERSQVLDLMRGARALLFPSLWYEGFPMTIVESFSAGRPVLASQLGSMAEIVTDGVTGAHFTASDPDDLARRATLLWENPAEAARLGANARRAYEARYTGPRNYELLLEIYDQAGQAAVLPE